MNVNGVGHSVGVPPMGLGAGRSVRLSNEAEGIEPDADAASPVEPYEDPDIAQDPHGGSLSDVENNDDSLRGVLRLMLEGHFKGVADVRLRINFHDELTAAGIQEAGPVASEKIASLSEAVDAHIEELRSSGALTETQLAEVAELQDNFNSAIKTLVNDFLSTTEQGSEALMSGVRSAFDVLLASLTSLLDLDSGATVVNAAERDDAPPIMEPDTVTGDSETEGGADIPTTDPVEDDGEAANLQLFLDQLVDTFTAAINDLTGVFDATAFLPPLSPPEGNGVAYAKFLGIYNDLLGLGQSAEAGSAETLDVIG